VVSDPAKLLFYDVWVARDVEGKPLSNTPPFVQHGYSLARLAAGLPFPASCCWNGLLALRAEPFVQGYRFRRAPMCHPGLLLMCCLRQMLSGCGVTPPRIGLRCLRDM
jgi:hypothetical protein